MKILLTQNASYIPTYGGTNKANRLLMEGLAQRQHNCQVVVPLSDMREPRTQSQFLAALSARGITISSCTSEVIRFRHKGVEVHAITDNSRLPFYLARQIQDFRPSWTLVSSGDPEQLLLETAIEKSPEQVIYLVHTPLVLPFGPGSYHRSQTKTEMLRRVAGIITVSNYLKEYMQRWGDLESAVIPFPIYGPGPFASFGSFDTGFVTMINPCAIKGIAIFLALARALPSVQFAAVPGWGTTHADTIALGQLTNLHLLAPGDDIDEILAQTRVLLVPSLWDEAFGLIVVEAMLRGIPVLASNAGGLPEAKLGTEYVLPVHPITRYEDRFDDRMLPIPIVPDQEIGPWLQALRSLLANRVHYAQLSEASRHAATAYVATIGITPFENFLDSLTSVPRTNHSAVQSPLKGQDPKKDELRELVDRLSPARRALLALRLKKKAGNGPSQPTIPPVSRAEGRNVFPLSFAQQRLWFLDQLIPGNTAYNELAAFRLNGSLNIAALEQSLNEIIRRHEILRTTFVTEQGQSLQIIASCSSLPTLRLSLIDLEALPEEQCEARVQLFAREERRKPFDLAQGPLMRNTLVRLSGKKYILLLGVHHIVSDGWSIGVFMDELAALYEMFAVDLPPRLPELPIQYADFAVWQRRWLQGAVLEEQVAYWRKQLADFAVLELPADFPRPLTHTFRGALYRFVLPLNLSQQLRSLSQREEVTLFMTLLGAFQVLLARYSGQEDLAIGTPIAGRTHTELERLIGFFVNILVLRTNVSGNPSFRELLPRVREVALGAYAHQDLPFERLVEDLQPTRDSSRNPLCQVTFQLQNALPQGLDLSGITVKRFEIDNETSRFDVSLTLIDGPQGLIGSIEYNTDVFTGERIRRMTEHYRRLLESIVANPEQRLLDLPLLSPSERQQILIDWNATGGKPLDELCVHSLFETQVVRSPDAIAVAYGSEQITYEELNRRANQLAHYLQSLGVGPEALVGICLERSLDMVVGITGTLKAGGAYIPVDLAYPQERLEFMLHDAQVFALLTHERLITKFASSHIHKISLDTDRDLIELACAENPVQEITGENLAYVIYTSGSTGRPKGTMIPHRGIVNYLNWCTRTYPVMEGGSPLHSSIGFDLTITSLFSPFLTGQRIVLLPEEQGIEALSTALRGEEKFSFVKLTPAHLELLGQLLSPAEVAGCTRTLVIGGETLWAEQLAFWREHAPNTRLFNEYGPTETSVGCCVYEIPPGESLARALPIGRPIANMQLYVLDSRLQPQPVGVPGELYIGGIGVARGYLNRPGLTAEQFVPHPFSAEPGARLYHTGDVARYLSDGTLEYLGRVDQQVKLRGFRIELGEIETTLIAHPQVQQAAAAVVTGSAGNKQLVAYVVPHAHSQEQERALSTARVADWRQVFDDQVRNQPAPASDPTFNLAGWHDSYTGLPFPEDEMEVWLEDTLAGIRAVHPQRVLEIGCGTGLLLLRLAPECLSYCGTDFSPEALAYVQHQLLRSGQALPQVALLQRAADEFMGWQEGSFDTVILNSVVQYFPSIDYLLRVLAGAIQLLAPQGHIVIGDVRSFPLLEAFHTLLQLASAPTWLTRAQLRQRVRHHLRMERELVLDPAFFTALPHVFKQINQVEIVPKRGRSQNELTQFRYQVILHLGPPQAGADEQVHRWRDWSAEGWSLAQVRQTLAQHQPGQLALAAVPNARLQRVLKAMDWLRSETAPQTVEELQIALVDSEAAGVDPEDFWELADTLPYKVALSWAQHGSEGCYDVVLQRSEPLQAGAVPSVPVRTQCALPPLRPWHEYANRPLHEQRTRALLPQLRQYLQERVPNYMLPSSFVMLETLPLTINGKLNRQALPVPESPRTGLEDAFMSASTPHEQLLVDIWSQVLGIESISIHDNFFELGGDSILSIQIIARAHQAGLHLTVKQMFAHQTIAQLASMAGLSPMLAEQESAVGEALLTPIQHWFFSQQLPNPHHWNQAVMLKVHSVLNPSLLEQAILHLLEHHDALRLRFLSFEKGDWQQSIAIFTPGTSAPFMYSDIARLSPEDQRTVMEESAAKLQTGLSLEKGPLLRVAYFNLGGDRPGYLLFIIHHLAVDGVSWRILLEDFSTAYEQLRAGQAVSLPARTTSFRVWTHHLVSYAQSSKLLEEKIYWLAEPRTQVTPLPLDYEGGLNTRASSKTIEVALNVQETQALLHEVPSAYHTRINDILLTALGLAFAHWTGRRQLLLDLEGHGREDLFADLDISRTVGWFTTLFPVVVDLTGINAPEACLKTVKEQLRQIPQRGSGYGLLRYLRKKDDISDQLEALPQAEVNFNYLGQLDQTLISSELFSVTTGPAGPTMHPKGQRIYLLEVNAWIVDGQLRLTWTYSEQKHRRETIERLANDYIAELRQLIRHCQSPEAAGYTPSDFPLAHLSQDQLEQLLARLKVQQEVVTGKQRLALIEDLYPLSPVQQGMLFHSLSAPGSGVYVEQIAFTLHGTFHEEAFVQSWQWATQQHAVLRSAMQWEGLEEPLQVVFRKIVIPVVRLDWRRIAPREQQAQLALFLQTDSAAGFELSQAPLQRLALIRLAEDQYQCIWSHHHILLDGWSTALVFKDVWTRYLALIEDRNMHVAAVRPYSDYILWLQQQDIYAAETFWRQRLKGFTAPTPLPGARETVGNSGAPGDYAEKQLRLPETTTSALRTLGRQQQITINTLVQGVWALTLGRYSGQQEVVFGSVVSGRPADLWGVEKMTGPFINTLPIRVRVSRKQSVLVWLKDVQMQYIDMYQYEHSPLVQVQGWSEVPRGLSLFESILVYENYPVDTSLLERSGDLKIDEIKVIERTNYALNVVVVPQRELLLQIDYDRRRFDASMIDHMLQYMQTLLASIVANPQQRVEDLPVLSEVERQQLLVEWNATGTAFPRNRCVHEMFEAQGERTPEAIALVCEEMHLTYYELNRYATRLASSLRDLGAGPEVRVGICLDRSVELVVALLAVLKAGSAYVPLDPSYPRERLTFMFQDARVAVLLTQMRSLPELPAPAMPAIYLDAGWQAGLPASPYECEGNGVTEANLAYVIYTSGSTGQPKGVPIVHRAVVNFLHAMQQRLGLTSRDRLLALTTLSFDIAALELFLPLSVGACCVLGSKVLAVDGRQLSSQLDTAAISVMQATPSTWRLLVAAGWNGAASLTMLCGGEALSADLARHLRAYGKILWNLYGPTETTIWSSIARLEEPSAPPSIGHPLANTQIYLLDEHLQPVPVGVAGELYIGGISLARGYLNQPALSAERFVPHPFSKTPGERLYRTGDLARYLADGRIVYLGRTDTQVKVRGHRIELGEIESVLNQHQAVRQSVVSVQDVDSEDRRLVAHIVLREPQVPTAAELRRFLQDHLPEYMLPSIFVIVDALPLTSNGKVDRRALPPPAQSTSALASGYRAPDTEAERIIAAIWQEVLHVEKIGIYNNFFELGGHSLHFVRVQSKLREAFEREIAIVDLLRYTTVSSLAKFLSQGQMEAPAFRQMNELARRQKEAIDRQKRFMKKVKREE